MDRPGNVLDLLRTQILETEAELVAHLVAHDPLTQIPPGSASPSSRAATLTPSPKMSASSEMMSPRLIPIRNSMRRSAGFGRCALHFALDVDGATNRVDDAGELDQEAVAGGFDDAATVCVNLGVGNFAPNRL